MPYCLPQTLDSLWADGWAEADEELAPIVSGRTRPESEAQEVKAVMLPVALASGALTVDDPGLFRMQLKQAKPQPPLNFGLDPLGLPQGAAVDHYIVCIPFEMDAGEFIPHPLIKGQMQKYIGQKRTDHAPLWGAAIPRLTHTVLELHVHLKPAFDVKQSPFTTSEPPHGPHD